MRPKFFDDMIVSLETPEQVRLWTTQFGVSVSDLELAMARAGNRFNDIREELGLARIYFFPRDDRVMKRCVDNGVIKVPS